MENEYDPKDETLFKEQEETNYEDYLEAEEKEIAEEGF
jgi:hypothetical protein